ncbi:MAG TPA: orotate phosphoribosyltransferase [Nitrososphaerales archaeon]|nr:orotate phosphoribosyltransferase [Nitrososphaerales archaeon]
MRRDDTAELVEGLQRIGALRLGQFTLSSGRKSEYYVDLRLVPSHPEVYRRALDAYRWMSDTIGTDRFDAIAGIATSGLLMSAPLAVDLGKPMVYVRREDKGHGTRRLVEGDVPAGSRALLVDDLATSGESLAEAVMNLRTSGLVVTDALVLVDRLEGAGLRLKGLGVELRTFVTIDDLAPALNRGITK